MAKKKIAAETTIEMVELADYRVVKITLNDLPADVYDTIQDWMDNKEQVRVTLESIIDK